MGHPPFLVRQKPVVSDFQEMQQKPDVVILNAEVLTMGTSQPSAKAVAVAQERISTA